MNSRPADPRPIAPWRPRQMQVWGIYRRERKADGARSSRRKAPPVMFDVRFHVDGHQFRVGFERKGHADTFADQLHAHFAAGHCFDPTARRFLIPGDGSEAGPTFVENVTEHFRRKWPSWAPSRRQDSQRELARACLHLVRDDAPALSRGERVAADEFLRRVLLTVAEDIEERTADREWHQWFARWSLPLREVNDRHLTAFLEAVRTTALDGSSRVLVPTSLARTRAVVRAVFTAARKRRLLDWDPWDAVEWSMNADEDQIDPDLVPDQAQVLDLAEACGAHEGRYECFVLVQGFGGLRPGEAREVRRRDFDLDSVPATVTVRGSHSDVPERFFSDGETRRRPLKGRGGKARRTIPIPADLVPRFRSHLEDHVVKRPDSLMFTTPSGKRIHPSNFNRDVWAPAREQVFEEGSPLRGLRRHDLRHAAITSWLNAGVTLKTAQSWSGHRTASVLLNTYLGVMRDDLATSVARTETALAEALLRRKA